MAQEIPVDIWRDGWLGGTTSTVRVKTITILYIGTRRD
jgi:hypothetical protein